MLNKGQKGLLMVEVAIILLVLVILAGIFAPSISDFVNTAQAIKAKSDIEVVGVAIARLTFDTGSSCIKQHGFDVCTAENQVILLYSEGPDVSRRDVANSPIDTRFYPCPENVQANWHDDDGLHADSMNDQLITNAPNYPRTDRLGGDNLLGAGSGWRGAYISDGVGADPWGHRYLANVMFMASPVDQSGPCEGQRGGPRWSKDAFVISAGPNGIFETPFSVDGASSSGDDVIFVLAGNGT